MKATFRTIALVAALAAGGAGLLQSAQAQSGAAPAAQASAPDGKPGPGHFFGHRGPGRPGEHFAGFMGVHEAPLGVLRHLKPKLNLTEAQQKLWSAAEEKGRDLRTAMRDRHEQDRKALNDQIAAGPLDAHALAARETASREALRPQVEAVRDAWIATYDSFDATQKQTVTDAVKKDLAHGEHMRDRMRKHG